MSRVPLIAATAALLMALGLMAGCSGAPAATAPDALPAASPAAEATSSAPVVTDGPRVSIKTDKGVVIVALDAVHAPVTVANFLKLAKSGFYDGVLIHRVEPGFVVQAGDPLTRGLSRRSLLDILQRRQQGAPRAKDPAVGTGGPGWSIPLEDTGLLHDRGVIAMARSTDPDSAGSQFYITLDAAHQLDGAYAVFGSVTKGMDVVDSLAVGDKILSVTVMKD